MSKLLEFFLGSILISVFTVATVFFFGLHYILKAGGIADCTWHGSARTWLDSNRDGLINDNEPPLSDIGIHINDLENRLFHVNWPAITDKDGDVSFNVSIPGCSNTKLEIYVDIPEGYHITTRPRVEVHPDIWASLDTGRVYYFGFVSDR